MQADETSYTDLLKTLKFYDVDHHLLIKSNETVDEIFQRVLQQADERYTQEILTRQQALQLFAYDVPKKVQGGGFVCSRVKDEKKFDLLESVFKVEADSEQALILSRFIHLLYSLVNELQQAIGCEWLGIYKNFAGCLFKLSYFGKYSRADFPIDEEHAKSSTNSRVALNGIIITWSDVSNATTYYSCDTKVQSECCVPIFGEGNQNVIGIIDAEAHSSNFFTLEKQLMLIRACFLLRNILNKH